MPNSGDSASRKCLSGVLSRMLCSGSLPTHPSEQLTESSSDKFGDQNIKQVVGTTAASPGVVARLMGLESFPTTPRDTTLGAYFRSKSVNSIDFLSYFDPIKHGHHQHRRVRSSVSFHYQGVNDDDFTSIVLRETGENRDEKEELFIRKWPDEQSREYFQEEGKERRKNREYFQVSNRPGKNREIFQDSGPGNLASRKKDFQEKTSVKLKERRPTENSKEEMVGSKRVKMRRKKKKKIHPEAIVPEVARSSRNQLQSQNANSRNSYSRRSREDAIIKGKNERKVKIKESCYYKRMVEEICMLSEEDLKENWIHGKELKFEDFEEIIQQFGHEILEVLLNQFVDELVLLLG